MAISKKKINYRELYPEVSDEIISVLKTSDRKMEYQQYDLKVQRVQINAASMTVTFTPSREDSLERLLEDNKQFTDETENIEECVIKKIMCEKLHLCLQALETSERELIQVLFFQELSERQFSEKTGIPQKTINDRRHRIIAKLKKMMEI